MEVGLLWKDLGPSGALGEMLVVFLADSFWCQFLGTSRLMGRTLVAASTHPLGRYHRVLKHFGDYRNPWNGTFAQLKS